MANRHFAKLGDVWKHLPLAQILFIERPANCWETHAGNASYPMVDDAERRYGAVRFAEVAVGFPALARSSESGFQYIPFQPVLLPMRTQRARSRNAKAKTVQEKPEAL